METTKKQIVCPLDQEEVKCSAAELKRNFLVLSLMDKQSIRMTGKYFCNKHPKEEFKFRCNLHKELLCSLCIWDHADHKKDVDIYTEEEFLKDLSVIETKIDTKIQELQKHKQIVQDIKKGKLSFTDKIKEVLADVLKLFTDLDANMTKVFPFSLAKGIVPIKMQENIVPLKMQEDIASLLAKKDIEQSSILTLGEADIVMKWLPNPNSQAKLLFRGSRDGFDAKKFHEKCDNKGPTLVIYKSHLNKVFGGYSSIPWNGVLNNFSQDTTNSCFLFSVTNKTKHILKKNEYEIYNDLSYGATFGGGHDICILDKNTISNYSNFGGYYVADGIAHPTTYLAGVYNFTLLDYEVFQITN